MTSEQTGIEEMTLEEIKAAARERVKPEVWDWVNGGTETESTLQRNRLALEKIMLRLRVIHGLETANTGVKILGQTVATPVMVAPFANMRAVHPEAEVAIAKGAEKAGAMMFLGPLAGHSIEQIVGAVNTPVVWNGEPWKDREKLSALIQQADKAGCRAVGLCVDDFVGIKIKDHLRPLPRNCSLSEDALRELRKATSLPFFLKGIMTVEDALTAAGAGVDAIVVSNHGGRVLDCCQASIEVLPQIVRAVGGRMEVLVDGGFRRGADVLKALALGAKGVLVGRPICWGLGAAGAEGVARVLQLMTDELMRAMMLTNVPDLRRTPGDAIVSA
ncbi:MAG: alpha-hydroxy-acid oxidizing protein [Chloroflexi bacterium]|nr:alpha-hydroxy-acid oxidizing protein [Chloroflexota bacterium]